MLNTICSACEHGDCENCLHGQAPPEGVLGGWQCVCDHDAEQAAARRADAEAAMVSLLAPFLGTETEKP